MKEVLEVVKRLRNKTGFFNFQDTSYKGKKHHIFQGLDMRKNT